ncbi:hypothetical protein ALC53_12323, partial [Atta colombica]
IVVIVPIALGGDSLLLLLDTSPIFVVRVLSKVVCNLFHNQPLVNLSLASDTFENISFPKHATPVPSRYASAFRTFRTTIVIAHQSTSERNRFRVPIAHDNDVSNRLRDRRRACSTSIRSAAQPTVSDCSDSSLSFSMTLALGGDASGGADAHLDPVARLSVGA